MQGHSHAGSSWGGWGNVLAALGSSTHTKGGGRRPVRPVPAFAMTLTGGTEEFEQVRARGAKVIMEPTYQQYGGTDALIDDTVGNTICLHQD